MEITHEGRKEKVKIVIFATLNKYHMSADEFHFRMEYDGRVAQCSVTAHCLVLAQVTTAIRNYLKFVAYYLSKFY